jgi:hypothetical protein
VGLSRGEFFARIGLLREIDPLVDLSFRFEEQRNAGKSDRGAAAEHDWHVSFHGSQFPGDDPKACGRQSLYRMIDMPRSTGSYLFSHRKLTQVADAGKDIENRLVMRWHNAGFLLSPAPVDPFGRPQLQQHYEEPSVWLTSTVDSIVLWPRSVMPVVAEVKTKYADVIRDMKRLIHGPDEKHIRQLKTQIAMVHADMTENPRTVLRCHNTDRMAIPILMTPQEYGEGYKDAVPHTKVAIWCPQHRTTECLYESELVPPEYGFLYYVSRDNPIDTHEFYFEYDPKFYEAGLERLRDWRQHFINDELPQTNFKDKRYAHPFGWKWGEQPCEWCDFGNECRVDMRKSLEEGRSLKLSESEAILEAQAIRPDYNFDLVRAAVFKRWDYELEEVAA